MDATLPVTIESIGGANWYILNGKSEEQYFGVGRTYTFTGVPDGHPMRLLQTNGECIPKRTSCTTIWEDNVDFCHGDVVYEIPEDCTDKALTVQCGIHQSGVAMGGIGRLTYSADCNIPPVALIVAISGGAVAAVVLTGLLFVTFFR